MKAKTNDLTKGNITKGLWGFAIPLMFGNVLQQLYNLVDTWVVGRYVGDNALAAVGSSYTLMTFLTSIIIGLCLGSSSFISMAYGRKRDDVIRNGILIYFIAAYPVYRIGRADMHFEKANIKDILSLSGFTCLQQSVMNFGILCVQGIVNSFGTTVMAAFAVAVKIDTIAYMPVQDFGNAFSVFVAQNFGAGKADRIRSGIRQAGISVIIFCVCISAIICGFARPFMSIFVDSSSVQVINVGVQYLRIEGAFYIGIGILFMLYGYYRAVNRPMMSVVLTVISLGTRVLLAYVLSAVPAIGVVGIWVAIPIGWFLADAVGIIFWRKSDHRK